MGKMEKMEKMAMWVRPGLQDPREETEGMAQEVSLDHLVPLVKTFVANRIGRVRRVRRVQITTPINTDHTTIIIPVLHRRAVTIAHAPAPVAAANRIAPAMMARGIENIGTRPVFEIVLTTGMATPIIRTDTGSSTKFLSTDNVSVIRSFNTNSRMEF